MITFNLPIPPSVNKIWRRSKNGMFKSANYQKWILLARVSLSQIESEVVWPQVNITITINGGKGWRSNRDIDNVPKGILDSLVLEGIIPDDNCDIVRKMTVEYLQPKAPKDDAYVTVQIRQYEST
jgi:Holliday junction resolvase RusA-like endonuclease